MGLGRAAKHKDKEPESQNLDEKGGEVKGEAWPPLSTSPFFFQN